MVTMYEPGTGGLETPDSVSIDGCQDMDYEVDMTTDSFGALMDELDSASDPPRSTQSESMEESESALETSAEFVSLGEVDTSCETCDMSQSEVEGGSGDSEAGFESTSGETGDSAGLPQVANPAEMTEDASAEPCPAPEPVSRGPENRAETAMVAAAFSGSAGGTRAEVTSRHFFQHSQSAGATEASQPIRPQSSSPCCCLNNCLTTAAAQNRVSRQTNPDVFASEHAYAGFTPPSQHAVGTMHVTSLDSMMDWANQYTQSLAAALPRGAMTCLRSRLSTGSYSTAFSGVDAPGSVA